MRWSRGLYDHEVNLPTILDYGGFGLGDLISLDGDGGTIYPGRLIVVPQRRLG